MIPTKKRIALLHPEVSTKGGAVSMMLYLARVLSERGNEVVFFTTKYDKKKIYVDSDISIVVSSKMKIIFQLQNFDYMFIGNSPMQFIGVLSKFLRISKAKIFWWHHHYPWYYNNHTTFYVFLKKYIEKICVKYVDEMLVNSQYLKDVIKQVYKKDSKILYPVVDTVFLNKNKNKNIIKQSVLFTYGRRVEGKNLKQIFTTYDAIKKRVPKLELYIAGNGEKLEIYQSKYKNDTNVKFLGSLEKNDLVRYLEQAKVFLFPSQVDSFGMAAAEAIGAFVPVVGFDGRGLSEIVQNEKNGCTVDSSDEFTKKTFCLLTENKFYQAIAQNLKTTPCKFSQSQFETSLEDIFVEKNKNI